MKKNIAYRGLVANVSAHDATDGELGSVLNLIPEDGALKPLELPSAGGGTFIGGSSCSVVAVHGVNGQLNYIICCTEGTPKYFWKASTDTGGEPAAFDDFTTIANGVVAIGNILCFAFDDGVKYAVWENGGYTVVSNFGYYVQVNAVDMHGQIVQDVTDDYIFASSAMGSDFPDVQYSDDRLTATITGKQARTLFNALDSSLNKVIEDNLEKNLIKYVSVGFVALKMYDGTYTMLSDLFVLAPPYDAPQDYNTAANRIKFKDGTISCWCYQWPTKYTVNVSLDNHQSQVIQKLIAGASVFLSPPIFMRNVDTTVTATKTTDDFYVFNYPHLTSEKLIEMIESQSFYKSVDIPIEKLGGTTVELKSISETNEYLTAADFRRGSVAGKVAYAYNNRLHLANTANVFTTALSVRILHKFAMGSYEDQAYRGALMLDNVISEVPAETLKQVYASVKARVTMSDTSTIFITGVTYYPLPPILMFPNLGAVTMTLYLSVGGHYYKYENIPLAQSQNFGCSYYINVQNNVPAFWTDSLPMQPTSITQADYNAFAPTSSDNILAHSGSELKVSEVENPFVFPAANTVAVGNGTILAMAANTKPVSEGQFGDYPLYVFTDEATWALNLNNTGTYVSRHPVSRDVISNVKSLTPIDDAVLFGTKRGVMMLAGSKTLCITDVLDGVPFLYMHMPLAVDVTQDGRQDVAIQRGLGYVNFHTFLTGAEMLFDYQAQRLFLYNTAYDYVYVYSFKSKMWGACANMGISGGISVASGSLVMLTANNENYVQEVDTRYPSGTVEVFACTRPLRFEGEHVFKTIDALLVRGNFDKAHLSTILYGANEVYVDPTKATYDNWHAVNSSQTHRLLNHPGTPYKWYRVAFVGCIKGSESVNGFDVDLRARWNNKLR